MTLSSELSDRQRFQLLSSHSASRVATANVPPSLERRETSRLGLHMCPPPRSQLRWQSEARRSRRRDSSRGKKPGQIPRLDATVCFRARCCWDSGRFGPRHVFLLERTRQPHHSSNGRQARDNILTPTLVHCRANGERGLRPRVLWRHSLIFLFPFFPFSFFLQSESVL